MRNVLAVMVIWVAPSVALASYDQEYWEEALSYYRDFSELHPDHERVPYTILRAARAYYHQSRPANRDQTATKQAIAQLERLRDDAARVLRDDASRRMKRIELPPEPDQTEAPGAAAARDADDVEQPPPTRVRA